MSPTPDQELAVSSLGAPELSLTEFVDLAVLHGCGALELRCAEGQPINTALGTAERREVRRLLHDRELRLLALASYVRVCAPDTDVAEQLRRQVDLAHDVGAHAVRVFPGGGETPTAQADARGLERLADIAPHAVDAGVRVCLETHDSHPAGADIARVLRALDTVAPGHGIGVVWDVLHPWLAGEAPEQTARLVQPWLDWVQIKDSAGAPGAPVPALVGTGQVPLDDVARALASLDYQGWLSLEWEKAWFPDIDGLDAALTSARRWVDATRPRRRRRGPR